MFNVFRIFDHMINGDKIIIPSAHGGLNLKRCETIAIKAAKEAGKLIIDAWGKAENVEEKKSHSDIVTVTDKKAEELIFSILKKQFPNYKFIGEETTSADKSGSAIELTDEPTWIVDPIDGTVNFVHGNPFVSVSIGLTLNKKPILGIVYCPIINKLYRAISGQGAFCNDKKISVSKVDKLKDAVVCFEIGVQILDNKPEKTFGNLQLISWKATGVRSLGSAAIEGCYVAAGHFDAFYEFGIWPWDMCAATIIVREAGGYICDTSGGDFDLLKKRWVVAATKELADEIVANLPHQFDYLGEEVKSTI